ncbi:MAG TPA: hypothetical protein VLI67_00935, partial [Vicinamibacteria bacterium]|nr:hypothetical protein [Vicinamibacteria bacterium]
MRPARRAASRRAPALALPLAILGLGAAPYVAWEDLTEADALYGLATRFAAVDGHRVHYPTPTGELATALALRAEDGACSSSTPHPIPPHVGGGEGCCACGSVILRHLAEARRELGDLPGALVAMEKWAEAEGPEAWAEAARWAAAQSRMELAFRAASRALPGLDPEARRALADEQVRWADAHPEAADPMAVRGQRARLFPADPRAVEGWIRALEAAGRLEEADEALARSPELPPARRLLLRSDLLADHGRDRRAFEVLDAALEGQPWTDDLKQAWAERTRKGSPGAPEAWRAALEKGFEPRALLRLATYFQGQGRGDAAAELLAQVERRYEPTLDRPARLLVSRLH